MEGWGKLSTANLKYSIEEKKSISFEKFIYSLGIRHIGLFVMSRNMQTPVDTFWSEGL